MKKVLFFSVVGAFLGLSLMLLSSCSGDEDNSDSNNAGSHTISVPFEKPFEIQVNSTSHQALLLHDRNSPSGPALQLVDLATKSVIKTLILDYYDIFDAVFVSSTEACFAGRPQGNIGYAVQFFSLPSLTLTSRVMTADTSGVHGYLAVDTVGGYVYYSHAGGQDRDGVYRISVNSKRVTDADADTSAPHGFDNGLVEGLFNQPAKLFFDYEAHKLVVADLGDNYVTMLDASLWGTLNRNGGLTFPITGTSHLSTADGDVSNVRADAMETGAGVYVFAGTSGNIAYLSRFETSSNGLDFLEVVAHTAWRYRNADIQVHPRQDIFSVFVLQSDTVGTAIGQYRLSNLQPVASSPYRTRYIARTDVFGMGIDTGLDQIVVGDAAHPRLELIDIQ